MEGIKEGGHDEEEQRGFISKKLHDIRVFVVVACWYTLTLFMVEMYIMSVLTTIEKRFGFKSSSVGALISAKEIAYVVSVSFLTQLGDKWHRPRFLAVTAFVAGIGSAICALPHFLYESPYQVSTNSDRSSATQGGVIQLPCLSSNYSSSGNDETGSNNNTDTSYTSGLQNKYNPGAYAIFQVSYVIIGAAISPMVALIATYVDDATGPKKLAFYFAFLHMMRPLGPVLGYLTGGIYANLHESLTDPGYDSSDPRWVGAWWLGYVANPCLLLTAIIPIAFFPKKIQRKDDEDMGTEMSSKKTPKKTSKKKDNPTKDFFQAIWRLLKNPEYMCLIAGGIFSAFVASGMFTFMLKYFEVQFHLTTSKANVLSGVVGMVGMAGIFLGGIISSRMNLNPSQSALFIAATDIIFVACLVVGMFASCPTRIYPGSSSQPVSNCSSSCWCPPEAFEPVCGADGVSYFSPCHAGCTTQNESRIYKGCLCVVAENPDDRTATPGYCDSECGQWIFYIIVLSVGAIIGAMASVPGTTVCLRIVEERDRSMAMGVVGTIVSLIGFLPSPPVYGLIVDSACLIWQEKDGITGSCLAYDNDKFRFLLHGISATLNGIGGLCFLLLWVLMKRREKSLMTSTEPTKEEHDVGLL